MMLLGLDEEWSPQYKSPPGVELVVAEVAEADRLAWLANDGEAPFSAYDCPRPLYCLAASEHPDWQYLRPLWWTSKTGAERFLDRMRGASC